MASSSFSLNNQFVRSTFSPVAPSSSSPSSRSSVRFRQQPSLRVSAAYATAPGRPSASYIAPQTSFYDVLGIQMGATCQEIKAAYRKLARVLHPDVVSNSGREDTSAAADEFIRLHKAYMILSDPEKRADYDSTLFRRRGSASVLTSATRYSGYTCRTWETDQCW